MKCSCFSFPATSLLCNATHMPFIEQDPWHPWISDSTHIAILPSVACCGTPALFCVVGHCMSLQRKAWSFQAHLSATSGSNSIDHRPCWCSRHYRLCVHIETSYPVTSRALAANVNWVQSLSRYSEVHLNPGVMFLLASWNWWALQSPQALSNLHVCKSHTLTGYQAAVAACTSQKRIGYCACQACSLCKTCVDVYDALSWAMQIASKSH